MKNRNDDLNIEIIYLSLQKICNTNVKMNFLKISVIILIMHLNTNSSLMASHMQPHTWCWLQIFGVDSSCVNNIVTSPQPLGVAPL
jgi:hypothetical protein